MRRNTNRPYSLLTMRADEWESALLLFLFGSGSGLGGLRFDHALLEFIHAASGIHKLLLASEERMAGVANPDHDHWLCGLGFDHVTAGATGFGGFVFRMTVCFH